MYCPLQRHRRFGGSLLSVRPDELPASIMMIPGSTPNGGAIVPGHPLGMSGARLLPLNYKKGQALCAFLVCGWGQEVAMLLERSDL